MKDYENLNENEKNHLLASVANLYYNHDLTQSQIAERLFTSRSKISRLLKEARERKIVEIKINEPWERFLDVEAEFLELFNLKDVRILSTKGAPENIVLMKIGEVAAYYIDTIIEKNMIVGISWGYTLFYTIESIKSSKNIPITVVQIMGAASKDKPEVDAMDLAKQLARAYGGKYHYLYAPLCVEDKEVRDKLMREPYIQDAISLARNADIILTSVGAADFVMTTPLWRGYMDSYTLHILQSKGAVGHIGGHFYDIKGRMVDTELDEKLIGISLEDIKKAPNVICIAGSVSKAKALLGAIRGGYVDTLIIDDATALRILELNKEF